MDAILLIIAALALGLNVAIHCLNSCHRGPLLLMVVLVAVEKGVYKGDLEDDENVARRSADLMSQFAKLWPNVSKMHVRVARSDDPLWWRRLQLFRHAATKIVLPTRSRVCRFGLRPSPATTA